MTKEELFKKYNIDESHNKWESIDNWMSVEVYRTMHNGELPPQDDLSIMWVCDFLDKIETDVRWFFNLPQKGSLYMTSKRMVYKFSGEILEQINKT